VGQDKHVSTVDAAAFSEYLPWEHFWQLLNEEAPLLALP
jgi:hypothetical protein